MAAIFLPSQIADIQGLVNALNAISRGVNPRGPFSLTASYAAGDMFYTSNFDLYLVVGAPAVGTGAPNQLYYVMVLPGSAWTTPIAVSFSSSAQNATKWVRVDSSRNLYGLAATGGVGAIAVYVVTAAQYAASGESATGTLLGTMTVSTRGTDSSTLLLNRAQSTGEYYRVVATGPSADTIYLYEVRG